MKLFTVDRVRALIKRRPYPGKDWLGPRDVGPAADRIECADGFSVSVQVGWSSYCTPRDNAGPWTKVELGFPSASLPPVFDEFCDDPDDPRTTRTVWGYVPIEMVVELLNNHGGEADS